MSDGPEQEADACSKSSTPPSWHLTQTLRAASSTSSKAVRRSIAATTSAGSRLALTCGYYDQSHFANDFHAFSGLNPHHLLHSHPPLGQPHPLD
ncbi:MAG: hypothetical protein ABI286_01740 [Edaphobacter sp.]